MHYRNYNKISCNLGKCLSCMYFTSNITSPPPKKKNNNTYRLQLIISLMMQHTCTLYLYVVSIYSTDQHYN